MDLFGDGAEAGNEYFDLNKPVFLGGRGSEREGWLWINNQLLIEPFFWINENIRMMAFYVLVVEMSQLEWPDIFLVEKQETFCHV